MIYELMKIIYQALSASFGMADRIFTGVGIALVTAVCIMVLVSSILRLFTARFIGSQIVQADERIKDAEAAKQAASYEAYAAKRDRNRSYDARYRKERGIKGRN